MLFRSTLYELAAQEQVNANTASQIMKELEFQLEQASAKQLPTPNTIRLLTIATRAFDRGDYTTALEKLKEAQLTYAVETKGEFNVQNFLLTQWPSIAGLSTIMFVVFYFFRR